MSPRIWPWSRQQRDREALVEPSRNLVDQVPAEIAGDGYRCVDCGAPCYAFGHLHADATWHDAFHPVYKPRAEE